MAESTKAETSAIIVAAGSATRMQGTGKILFPLGKTNVIGNTLLAFESCPEIKEIIIVAREEDFATIEETVHVLNISKFHGITIGGETRQKSVLAGLRLISKDTHMIAIHDGARPLVLSEDISRVITDATVFGAATLGVPVKDTIKIVEDNLIIDTPYRPSLYQTQTPQVFRRSLYFEAVSFAQEHCLDFTDDCQLIEAIGTKVYMTRGDYTNIKITTPEDIAIASVLLERRSSL